MRRFFAFVYCFSALAFAACDDNKGDSPEQWFRQPEVTVDGLTAEVTCLTLFGKGVLASNPCGFVCQPVSSASTAPAITVTDPRIEDSMLKCTLTSLAPETVYMVYPFVDMNGERMAGKPAVFQTWEAPEEPDPDNPGPDEPKPDPDPDPDPDNPDPDQPTPPQPGSYPGWPELPVKASGADLHYATHICPDYTFNGTPVTGLRSYTVCYSSDTRTAMWSAYPLLECYKGDESRSNAWSYDPEISQAVQPVITGANYKIPGVTPPISYSRGHFIASNDRTATEAMNRQTFYVTNVAPQWQNSFNGGVWGTLEGACWNNICADTLFVVTGVHFADNNTTVVDNAKPTPNTVVVPTNFYKVMIRSKAGNTGKPLYELKADELQCIAFWFGNKEYKGTTPSDFRTTVADVEQKTGMTFFPNVPNAPKGSDAGNWKF